MLSLDEITQKDALLNIGGDTTIGVAGFYMDVLTDVTTTEWFKLYIGQAERLNVRIGYHKKPTVLRNNTALHYQLLRKPGRQYNYVILGLLPSNLAHDSHLYDATEMYLVCFHPRNSRNTYLLDRSFGSRSVAVW